MTTVTVHTWSAGETAYALRRALGDARSWSDFLSDASKEKTTFHGLTLMPIAGHIERCRRPIYSVAEVLDFIKKALELAPPERDPRRIKHRVMAIPAASLCLPWRMRKATPCESGAPA